MVNTELINEKMYEKQITVSMLASTCKVAKSTIYRMINGEHPPGAELIKGVCDALGITPSQLMGWDEEVAG